MPIKFRFRFVDDIFCLFDARPPLRHGITSLGTLLLFVFLMADQRCPTKFTGVHYSLNLMLWGSPFLLAVTVLVVIVRFPLFGPPPLGKTAAIVFGLTPPAVNFE